jgi:glycosyltransferase involved in cell wall biosynthesis
VVIDDAAVAPRYVVGLAAERELDRGKRAAAAEEVILLGWRDDAPTLLAACDAQLNTSRWEGLSLSLLEGLWRGRPVIATDSPGNGDAAAGCGLLVAAEPAAVARAIERFFTEPGLPEQLAAGARRRAERLFDGRAMARATLELYDEVAGG